MTNLEDFFYLSFYFFLIIFCFKSIGKKQKQATLEQESLIWGTYGKDYVNWPNVTWKKLVECETDHLIAILKTQTQINDKYIQAICNILEDRDVKDPVQYIFKM